MTPSYKHSDSSYRRGLVLGLSLAEIFLILLFLLLLVSIGITSVLNTEKEQAGQEADKLRDQLTVIHEIVGNEITAEDFNRLVKDVAENQSLKEENQELSDKLATKEAELVVKEAELAIRESELVDKASELAVMEDRLTEAEKILEESREIREFAQENQMDAEDMADLLQHEKELQEQLQKFDKDMARYREDITVHRRALDSLSRKEGQDPACWFVNVPDENEPGETRQKHVKIFDVRISRTGFTVRLHDNSHIRGVDRGDTTSLPALSNSVLHRELTEEEFKREFLPFYDAGKRKNIRDYSCRFMVDIFDATPENDKNRYKYNLNVVEGIFYTFEETSAWNEQQ